MERGLEVGSDGNLVAESHGSNEPEPGQKCWSIIRDGLNFRCARFGCRVLAYSESQMARQKTLNQKGPVWNVRKTGCKEGRLKALAYKKARLKEQ